MTHRIQGLFKCGIVRKKGRKWIPDGDILKLFQRIHVHGNKHFFI